ncbi:methyltransferase [Dactylosporangium sp. NPDC051485]|uniref:methyltransferase n=1 Tax=Dactylosporangium sp. NPDC051485 TaxID=3154846 RepID=UPI00343C890C
MTESSIDRVYERFQLIVNGPALFNAIVAGLELDVFRYLREHPGAGFEDLHTFTGLPRHSLRVLLLALTATELVSKKDGRYTNSAVADDALAEDRPDSWRETLIGWRRFQYPAFPYATDALRAGRNVALDAYEGPGDTLYARLAHDPRLVAAYHDSIGPFTHLFVTGLLDNPELSTVRHLLDVGGGDGTTAIRFARRFPEAEVTIFDMPAVAERAELIVPDDLTGRIRLRPGDLFKDEFPTDVDAVLFSHVLEPFDEQSNVELLSKAVRALPSGGRIFTYGLTALDDEDGGLLAARLSLYLNVLVAAGGLAHPAADYERWLWQAGVASVKAFTGLPYEHGLVVGTVA